MNPILLEILPLIREGYCCSQLLMHLLLQGAGQENAALLRAMHGLCFGMGGTEGPCGLLSGGACILGCFAGRGAVEEHAHASLAPMVHEYQQWFIEHTRTSGLCYQILESFEQQDEQALTMQSRQSTQSRQSPQHAQCGELLATCWKKILEILEKYQVDMELKA